MGLGLGSLGFGTGLDNMFFEYLLLGYPWSVDLIIALSANISSLFYMHIFLRQLVAKQI